MQMMMIMYVIVFVAALNGPNGISVFDAEKNCSRRSASFSLSLQPFPLLLSFSCSFFFISSLDFAAAASPVVPVAASSLIL